MIEEIVGIYLLFGSVAGGTVISKWWKDTRYTSGDIIGMALLSMIMWPIFLFFFFLDWVDEKRGVTF